MDPGGGFPATRKGARPEDNCLALFETVPDLLTIVI